MKRLALALMLAALSSEAPARNGGSTSNFYSPGGAKVGSATTSPSGQTRFYDAGGNSKGTASTSGNTRTFYDARGNVIGRETIKGDGR